MYRLVTKHTESQLCAPLRVELAVALFYLHTAMHVSPLADFGRGVFCSDVSIRRFFNIGDTDNTGCTEIYSRIARYSPAIAWHLVCNMLRGVTKRIEARVIPTPGKQFPIVTSTPVTVCIMYTDVRLLTVLGGPLTIDGAGGDATG